MLLSGGINAEDFTRLALDAHGEGAAADFAIGGETFARHRRIEGNLTSLAAVGALDGGSFLHTQVLVSRTRLPQPARKSNGQAIA